MSQANRDAARARIKADRNLSTGGRLLLLYVGNLVGDGRLLDAGCDYLADELGTSRSNVRRWRDDLIDRGYLIAIRTVAGGQEGNTYRLAWDPTVHMQTVQRSTNGPHADRATVHQRSTYGRESESGRNQNRAMPNDPEACHHLIDDEGYCTRCKTWTREPASA